MTSYKSIAKKDRHVPRHMHHEGKHSDSQGGFGRGLWGNTQSIVNFALEDLSSGLKGFHSVDSSKVVVVSDLEFKRLQNIH